MIANFIVTILIILIGMRAVVCMPYHYSSHGDASCREHDRSILHRTKVVVNMPYHSSQWDASFRLVYAICCFL
jgi:hypothetical protein